VSAGEANRDKRGGAPVRSARAWSVLAAAALGGLLVDLASKSIAFARVAGSPVGIVREEVLAAQSHGVPLGALVPRHDPVRVVPSLLDFTLVLNPGAVFGIGAGKRWFFVIFTIVAMGVALWMFAKWTRARDSWAHVGLGLLIAGGLGNLYDRLTYACVRDFIHPLPGVRVPFGVNLPLTGQRELWPYVSNIADLWLLIGIAILLVHLWRGGQHARRGSAIKSV
jgi:signal peptidase II